MTPCIPESLSTGPDWSFITITGDAMPPRDPNDDEDEEDEEDEEQDDEPAVVREPDDE